MPNIRFSYLYRDGSNYKRFSYIIFPNPDDLDLKEFENLIKSRLIFDTWFYADKWKLPEIFTDYTDLGGDPTWHEFESVENTDENATSKSNLAEFINYMVQ